MKTLMLLRHAKSDWSAAGIADHDRPLNARGDAAAIRMGQYLARENLWPDLVLCSTALRTRETLAHLLDACDRPPSVRYEKALYLASPRAMLKFVQDASNDLKSLMLIGHNPGTHSLANMLAAAESKSARAELAEKFPTGALALLQFKGQWADVIPGSGQLMRFIKPRSLGDV
ncbi:SixA phosphatase family protein [Govanella unica]|uniref:Histidine phosphatase family protein n=1 Tax=Govanella unica TaxID=2975056 RepID=A0A9X3TVD1_9PROT|nr:histidine phosphatase family protein [Govania unica]MDA5192402.1 histidine phosphatase family protein [Govania unica]